MGFWRQGSDFSFSLVAVSPPDGGTNCSDISRPLGILLLKVFYGTEASVAFPNMISDPLSIARNTNAPFDRENIFNHQDLYTPGLQGDEDQVTRDMPYTDT